MILLTFALSCTLSELMPPKKRKLEGDWQGRRGKQKRSHRNKPSPQKGKKGAGYEPIIKENARFEKYYQGQSLVLAEEWSHFMATLQESLPSTFRITGTRRLAEAVRECLQRRFFSELAQIEVEGQRLAPPTPLPWYPDNLAWYVPLSRTFIRKSPVVSKFHRFLVDESDQGNISRQEAVSMIPPLLLDVQSHHKVLDMCAAPGSKTAQLIEMIHADEDTATSSQPPTGVVVANDADNKRCYMLVHQAKRLNSPCFMVTNHDASVFPMLYYHDENDVRRPVHYDRVLCDVPCSGDGTMRKNPTIWRTWNPSLGPSLHKLQLRILNRGLELLSPGGLLVYSTCSLNPVENEAVIATVLQLCKGSVELLDVSDKLPGLKTITGMISWKVMNKKNEWVSSFSEVPQNSSQLIAPTMFPPDNSMLPQLQLERCIRILPHHQDTGGFFVAVLRKSDWLPWQKRPKQVKPSCEGTSAPAGSEEQRPSDLAEDTRDEELGNKGVAGFQQGEEVGETEEVSGATVESCREGEGETRDSKEEEGVGNGRQVEVAGVETEGGEESISTESGCEIMARSETDSLDIVTEKESGLVHNEVPVQAGGEGEEDGKYGEDGEGGSTEQVEDNSALPLVMAEDMPAEAVVEEPSRAGQPEGDERPSTSILGRPQKQGKRGRIYKEDPYVFLKEDSDVYQLIKQYYGLPDSFPSTQLLTRSVTGKKRNLYLVSKLVKEILRRNELHVKIINAGVKILARCDHANTSCAFRLCQEGIETLAPFIRYSRVYLTLVDLLVVLKEPNPLTSQLAEPTQQALGLLGIGPALFKYVPDEAAGDSSTFHYPIYLSGWVARKSIRLYADKKYRCHFLAMLGHEAPANMSLASVSGRRNEEEEEMEMLEIEERKAEEEHEDIELQEQEEEKVEMTDGDEVREAEILEREEKEE